MAEDNWKNLVAEDNWKNRGQAMRCATCIYYVSKVSGADGDYAPLSDAGAIESAIGRCRRHAPTMNGWPVMYLTDWCGDHKLDETKLGSTERGGFGGAQSGEGAAFGGAQSGEGASS